MLINLRNALMAGKRLPYDAEVEFLESTGEQWIDTGVVATNNTRVKIAFSDYTQAGAWLFGTRRGFHNAALGIYTNPNAENNKWLRAFGNFVSNNFVFSTIDLGVSTFDYDCGHFTGTREKVPITVEYTDTASAFDSSPYTIYLWSVNLAGTAGTVSSAKIYATQIWQNGVLVRDFIPVRKGSTGYLYDRVSGKLFGNAGTGDFVLGPDVVPVEYLQSSGTEYIDTGVYATENTRVKATLMTISTGNKNWFGGAASGYTGFAINSYSSTQIEYYFGNGGWKRASGTDLVNRVFTLEFSKSSVSIDGVSVATPSYTSFPTQTSPITIFVRYGGTAYINGRVYSFQIYESGDLARKLLPVRVGTEGAMMDTLTRRIYRNAGTGAFTYGNDLKYPIPAE